MKGTWTIVLTALALTACGGGEPAPPAPAQAPEPEPAPPAVEEVVVIGHVKEDAMYPATPVAETIADVLGVDTGSGGCGTTVMLNDRVELIDCGMDHEAIMSYLASEGAAPEAVMVVQVMEGSWEENSTQLASLAEHGIDLAAVVLDRSLVDDDELVQLVRDVELMDGETGRVGVAGLDPTGVATATADFMKAKEGDEAARAAVREVAQTIVGAVSD